jgi:hypothetical protein
MKVLFSVVCSLAVSTAVAAVVSSPQTLDSGGQRSSVGGVVVDQSIGGVVGIATAASPEETLRHGYVGQLTDVKSLSVVPLAPDVDEGDSQALSGRAVMDDDSVTMLDGDEMSWSIAVFPLLSISTSGVATATNVYEDTTASVTGSYMAVEGEGSFIVVDVDDDNFGTYAGDGLPDGWQVGYFGIGNPEGGPTHNVDLDPFDNTGEWIADTIPTDSNSFFFVTSISNAVPDDMAVSFESSSSRRYSLEVTTNLMAYTWVPVPGQTNLPGIDAETWLTETNVPVAGLYRVIVSVP